MSINFVGAAFLILACTSIGFCMASAIKIETRNLLDFVRITSYMECELSFRLTPLATLCRLSAEQGRSLQTVFSNFAEELENQMSPDPSRCMDAALLRCNGLSNRVIAFLRELGNSFGKFDLQGQLSAIKTVRQRCADTLESLENSIDLRVRNYRTIGFCVGVAITIILL